MPNTAFRRLTGVALSATLATVTLAVNAPQAAAAETPSLRVLSYNAFIFSKTLYPNWGQDHRAAEIPKTSFFRGNDVVVIQEAFDNGASDALLRNSASQYPYQTPVVGRSKSGWDATGGSYAAATPEDGGVTILSKWPIVRKEQFVFKDACGGDWFSNKGFAYTVLNVNGARVHVVGTHAQSTDPGCSAGEAAQMRSRQFKQMDAFLDAKNIPASEQVVVAGDFNVDGHSAEYASFLSDSRPERTGVPDGPPVLLRHPRQLHSLRALPRRPARGPGPRPAPHGPRQAVGLEERRDQGAERPLDGLQLGQELHVHEPLRPLPGDRLRPVAEPSRRRPLRTTPEGTAPRPAPADIPADISWPALVSGSARGPVWTRSRTSGYGCRSGTTRRAGPRGCDAAACCSSCTTSPRRPGCSMSCRCSTTTSGCSSSPPARAPLPSGRASRTCSRTRGSPYSRGNRPSRRRWTLRSRPASGANSARSRGR